MSTRVLRASIAVYAGLSVAPVGTFFFQLTPAVVAAGALAGLLVGTLLAHRSDPTEWLAGRRTLVFAALPGVWVPAAFWTLPPAGGLPWIRLAGTTAVVPALVAVALANRRRTRRRLSGATTHAEFAARPAPTVRRQRKIAAAVLLSFSAAVSVAITLVAGGSVSVSTFVWLPALLPTWLALFQDDSQHREVAITDAGLHVEQGLHDWEQFSGYERTDETLTLARSDWYRSTLSFDIADIDDPETVTAELGRYLPKNDGFRA